MKTKQTAPNEYTLGPDCDSGCLDQGVRVCGHEFSMKHHLDDCKQSAPPAQAQHSPQWKRVSDEIWLDSKLVCQMKRTAFSDKSVIRERQDYIIRACNNAQRLADALAKTLNWLSSYPGNGAENCYNEAREALAEWSKNE